MLRDDTHFEVRSALPHEQALWWHVAALAARAFSGSGLHLCRECRQLRRFLAVPQPQCDLQRCRHSGSCRRRLGCSQKCASIEGILLISWPFQRADAEAAVRMQAKEWQRQHTLLRRLAGSCESTSALSLRTSTVPACTRSARYHTSMPSRSRDSNAYETASTLVGSP